MITRILSRMLIMSVCLQANSLLVHANPNDVGNIKCSGTLHARTYQEAKDYCHQRGMILPDRLTHGFLLMTGLGCMNSGKTFRIPYPETSEHEVNLTWVGPSLHEPETTFKDDS